MGQRRWAWIDVDFTIIVAYVKAKADGPLMFHIKSMYHFMFGPPSSACLNYLKSHPRYERVEIVLRVR